jgi:hypothetical protein
VSPVRYELGFYIPEDGILHSHRRENLISYTVDVIIYITNNVHAGSYSIPLLMKRNF